MITFDEAAEPWGDDPEHWPRVGSLTITIEFESDGMAVYCKPGYRAITEDDAHFVERWCARWAQDLARHGGLTWH